jgi:hypothetical protein
MRAFLNKGRGYKAWLEAAEGRSTKHLAEREGCSRPRICQLLVLTRLARESLYLPSVNRTPGVAG